MNPWLETLGVLFLVAFGVLLGRWFARLPRYWWTLGFFLPLLLVLLLALPRFWSGLEFVPPLSWLLPGRTEFALAALIATWILTTPLCRTPSRQTRRLAGLFMAVLVWMGAVWPFLAPAFNRAHFAALKTVVDGDGVCWQSTDYDCGPAAAVTTLRQLGLPAEEGELAILAHTSTAFGTPPDVLCAALQERYQSNGVTCEYRHFKSVPELNKDGLTIAVIKYGFLVDHYVAVLEVTNNKIVVGDPLHGRKEYSHEGFAKVWRFTGVVLQKSGAARKGS